MKEKGNPNDLIARIAADSRFAAIHDRLAEMLNPAAFVGRAPQQVEEFIDTEVDPLLARLAELPTAGNIDVNV